MRPRLAPPRPRVIPWAALLAALSLCAAACADGFDLPDSDADGSSQVWTVTGPDAPSEPSTSPRSSRPADGTVSDPSDLPAPTTRPPTLDDVHHQVFRPRCGSCHIDRSVPAAGFSLTLDDSLVDRLIAPSTQVPAMQRIRPGSVDDSYLWHKVAGSHTDIGGLGERCPIDGPPLDEEDMLLIQRLIEEGDLP